MPVSGFSSFINIIWVDAHALSMALMEWTDDLSVSVKEIDEQHKKLIGLINSLHAAMLAKQGKQVLEKTIEELAAYTVYHFKTEENYMQKFAYPQYYFHKKEHDAFVKKVGDFQADFSSGKLGLSVEIMNFQKDWVTNHIKGTDKGYSATFHKNGLN